MILVVDNLGFTTNILTHQLGAVHLVSAAELVALNLIDYSHVVIPHGTETPDLAGILAHPELPVLAIGSGYQQLASSYGHDTLAPAQPVYGQPVAHHHTATGILSGVTNPVELISYHAWRLNAMDPERFDIVAVDDAQAVLVYRVKGTNHWGLHCDPAALQSTAGAQILQHFLALAPTSSSDSSEPLPIPAAQRIPVFTRQVAGQLDTEGTFGVLQQHATAAFWLDSAAAHLGQGQTTIMGTNSGALSQTIRWDVATNRLDIAQDGQQTTITANVLDYLQEHRWTPEQSLEVEGFTGGWVGYLGYEAKQATMTGHTNVHQAATPDAYWIKPQAFVRYDHRGHLTTLVAYGDEALLDALQAALVFGSREHSQPKQHHSISGRWRLTAQEYQQRAADIQTLLNDGEAAGICLTDTYQLEDYSGDALALYSRLRVNNPAPYAGYLRFNTFDDELEILCASPEKFLKVDRDGRVESKPIKGTVARSNEPDLDAQIAQQMAEDPKIQSENLMITDLLRDDLAKVTQPGSVAVPKLMAVESFATVHQLVTTVTGRLRQHIPVVEAVKAVFPGGSMTGAPKRFSVETLEQFETGPRGIYSGAMGWLGDDNTAELNVVIRSMIINAGQLSIGAGGAVVVDSDPVAEELEKHLKAQALMDSIAEQA